jgi:hypothetical protein
MPPDMSAAELIPYYQANQTAASAREIRMTLVLRNVSDEPYDLSDVTLRYWFSAEPAPKPRVDYFSENLNVVLPTFASNMANSYYEFTFRAGGTVPVYVDQNSLNQGQIQFVIYTDLPNTNFDQSNDWSYDRTATASKPNPKITMYQGDTLIWGCEPSRVCAEFEETPGGEGGAAGASGG